MVYRSWLRVNIRKEIIYFIMHKISFLQAGNGDCIHIESNGYHVIIDSGEVCPQLVSVVDGIQKAKEKIDLLVITHYDSDHIKAIISILKGLEVEERKRLIKKVWFNATKVDFYGNEQQLSAQDATDFSRLLIESGIKWVSVLKAGTNEKIGDDLILELIDGGEIYKPTGEGKLLGNEKKDWNTSFEELEKYLDDDVLDTSKTNSQSAIIVAHIHGKSILLPGDATPDKLLKALDVYGKGESVTFDMVKLPHHGSYKNITQQILGKFECSDYIISTNGVKYYHPDKKMMVKVFNWGKKIEGRQLFFHLNYYDELFKQMNISHADMLHYNFDCDGRREFEL